MQKCYDCKKELKIKGEEIIGGKLLKYKIPNKDDIYIYKCDECYKKNPALTNYQSTEVYDRVVGYLRPVSQWNKGKQAERSNRKNYKTYEKI